MNWDLERYISVVPKTSWTFDISLASLVSPFLSLCVWVVYQVIAGIVKRMDRSAEIENIGA